MGIKTILQAKKIILLAAGKSKAQIIKETLNEVISKEIPATALRTHPHVLFILDHEAVEGVENERVYSYYALHLCFF